MPRSASVCAFAKVNLSLEVLNRRPDGFHNLRTVFQTISLHDTIDIEVHEADRPRVELISDVEIPGENLIVRAALALLEVTGAVAEVRFRLQKRIPMGGGLGGGSTDAAAVLLALPALLERTVDSGALVELGSGLGSDVPFFLMGGTAAGLNRGTELYPLPDGAGDGRFGVLLTPPIHVSTPEAYRLLGRTAEVPAQASGFSAGERLAMAVAFGADWSSACVNDFEAAVFGQHPELAELRARLEDLGASPARMSGSGAALFGVFDNEAGRIRALTALEGVTPAHSFEFVSRSAYRDVWRECLRLEP
ncbi:MAG: 4-(cytidine 5'-diphospho)-2-C-methyl-D-erythritol kinase [Bryobacteraceae bacterium]|nr:4-(cytidine 5'-diphospho)-2-C-methyl-D-erythritol kinase [Bryobacteraceae bacterium]